MSISVRFQVRDQAYGIVYKLGERKDDLCWRKACDRATYTVQLSFFAEVLAALVELVATEENLHKEGVRE